MNPTLAIALAELGAIMAARGATVIWDLVLADFKAAHPELDLDEIPHRSDVEMKALGKDLVGAKFGGSDSDTPIPDTEPR